MDFLIASAARALAAGNPLDALNYVGQRDDAAALALRGTAMAQLGDLPRAKALLRSAARAFGPGEALARARCVVAQAEVALAARDASGPDTGLEAARGTLLAHGDLSNAAHALHLQARRALITGRPDLAREILAGVDTGALPPRHRAVHELIVASIAMRRQRAREAGQALSRARQAARHAGIPALAAEVEQAVQALEAPAARLIEQGAERPLTLAGLESLLESGALVLDACRLAVRTDDTVVMLASRPVLFALARALAQAWPRDVGRDALIAQAFRTRYMDETHRARLRVEMGRLRAAIRPLAGISATRHGYVLEPAGGRLLAVLDRPVGIADPGQGAVLAFLADGESWSSASLAQALGISQRAVQRALGALADAGMAQSVGQGRARRWTATPIIGITTSLLLPAIVPGD